MVVVGWGVVVVVAVVVKLIVILSMEFFNVKLGDIFVGVDTGVLLV
jgi:hypothetical protein